MTRKLVRFFLYIVEYQSISSVTHGCALTAHSKTLNVAPYFSTDSRRDRCCLSAADSCIVCACFVYSAWRSGGGVRPRCCHTPPPARATAHIPLHPHKYYHGILMQPTEVCITFLSSLHNIHLAILELLGLANRAHVIFSYANTPVFG